MTDVLFMCLRNESAKALETVLPKMDWILKRTRLKHDSTNLSWSILQGSDFSSVNLYKANLSSTNMGNANFKDSNLENAYLHSVYTLVYTSHTSHTCVHARAHR